MRIFTFLLNDSIKNALFLRNMMIKGTVDKKILFRDFKRKIADDLVTPFLNNMQEKFFHAN